MDYFPRKDSPKRTPYWGANKVENVILPDIKIYDKAMLIKTAWYCQIKTNLDLEVTLKNYRKRMRQTTAVQRYGNMEK